MAMNIHQEARRRQMFMDRVCEARRRLTHSHDDTQQAAAVSEGALRSEPVMCTDQGQFYQTRPSRQGDANKQTSKDCVVFEKVVHDPNFYYRINVEQGLPPPLHVDPIHKLMYPGATLEFPRSSKE